MSGYRHTEQSPKRPATKEESAIRSALSNKLGLPIVQTASAQSALPEIRQTLSGICTPPVTPPLAPPVAGEVTREVAEQVEPQPESGPESQPESLEASFLGSPMQGQMGKPLHQQREALPT